MKNLFLLPIFLITSFFAQGQNDSLTSELPIFHLKIEGLPRYCDSLDRAMIKPLLGVPATDLKYQKFPDSVVILGQRMPDLMFQEIQTSDHQEIFDFWGDDTFGTRGMPEHLGENWLVDYKAQLWKIYEEAGKPIRRNLFCYYVDNQFQNKVLALVFWQDGKYGFQIFDLK